MRRLVPIALIAAVVAGCGSAQKDASSGGSIPAGASLVRSDVAAFVAVDSDLGSSQWQTFSKLWEKFPSHEQWVQQLKQSLSKQHPSIDYDRDVKPALGPEFDVAVAMSGDTPSVVGLTKPDDPAKFKALAAKERKDGSQTVTTRDLGDGWWGVAAKASDFDAVLKGSGGALADVDTFKAAIGKLPGETLARAYVDGPQLNRLAQASGSGAGAAVAGLKGLKYEAVSLGAEDDGLRLRGVTSGGDLGGKEFASKLLAGIPSDAFAALDFLGGGISDRLKELKTNPQFGPMTKQLEDEYGVTLDEVASLLNGEVAFYARPGTLIPEFTLALQPGNPAAALATLDKLMRRLAEQAGTKVETGTEDGHLTRTIDFGGYAIHYTLADGKLLLTTGMSGISDFGSSGSLSDSADFKEAKDAAGMPDSTGALIFIDLKDAIPLIEDFAGLSGQKVPSSVSENLKPLRSLIGWSQGGDTEQTFDAFLEIK